MSIKGFLNEEDELAVVQAISKAELNTSGEIRLHLENRCKGDVVNRAKQVFADLEMFKTKDKNGILIYIALIDHKLCIWGDEGIHAKLGQDFWDSEVAILIATFKENKYKDGLVSVIETIGTKLSEYFPYQSDDVNELDNDISFNAN
ncbi:MAG: TPM domain-containing protein [Bacteroidetes bacterium]|nr:TPM domain-containing protein [Bacteroidota bacterium]